MWCKRCSKRINGIVNKVRHQLAEKDVKLDNDCGKFREVPVGKAVHALDNEMVDLSLYIPKMKKTVTLREFMRIMRPPNLIKLNDRNHGEKAYGSDVYNMKYSRGYKDKHQAKKQRKRERAHRKARSKKQRNINEENN